MTDNFEFDMGGPRPLTPIETLMWRAESDPHLRSTVVAIEVLDREPSWERLVSAHRWAIQVVPRLRDRVVDSYTGVNLPRWDLDENFDLHYHVRRTRAPGDGGWSELLELAEKVAMTPFDRQRPLWEAILVEGLREGRSAYILKIHHAITDGVGIAQILSKLHSTTREHTPSKPVPAGASDSAARTVPTTLQGTVAELRTIPHVVKVSTNAVVETLRHPERSLREAIRYGASVRRIFTPTSSGTSEVLAHRSLSWRFAALDVKFADLRNAGRSVGGTVNDAYLASLLAGFRIYHEEVGRPVSLDETMTVSVPVSIRKEDDGPGGNRIAPARIDAPIGIVDPAKRISALHGLIVSARAEPALESADIVAPILCRLPSAVVAQLAGEMTKNTDLQASNVPGIRGTVYLAGARIDRIYPFAPLPGCAAMITMTSHGDLCCVGANFDAAAIEDPELFGRCLQSGFAEVLTLIPDSTPPVLLV